MKFIFPLAAALTLGACGVETASTAATTVPPESTTTSSGRKTAIAMSSSTRTESTEGMDAMGEGFGDYFAASFFDSRKPARYRNSVMSWDGLLIGLGSRVDPTQLGDGVMALSDTCCDGGA